MNNDIVNILNNFVFLLPPSIFHFLEYSCYASPLFYLNGAAFLSGVLWKMCEVLEVNKSFNLSGSQ